MVADIPATPRSLHELATPAALIDETILTANLARAQSYSHDAGVQLRPHVKTHKSTMLACEQRRLGANGLTVATIREAESMAKAGFEDLLLAFPPIGIWRLNRLAPLLTEINVTLVIDSLAGARAAAELAAKIGRTVPCRWEIDCGTRRCGTPPGAATVRAASNAFSLAGVEFAGFFTFPGHVYEAATEPEIEAVVAEEVHAVDVTLQAARRAGFPDLGCSGGTTPTAFRHRSSTGLVELRPGNYIFNDATQVGLGVATEDDCALTILSTVVDVPAPDRVVLDAGSKALAKDIMSPVTRGYGFVLRRPELAVSRIYEEHGIIDVLPGLDHGLKLGDRVEVLPNHACAATNLHSFYVVRNGESVVDLIPADARGWHASA